MVKHKATPIFNNIIVRVDVLNKNIQVMKTLLMIGDQFNKQSSLKTLRSIDVDYNKSSKNVRGGDIDWEDLDDEDLESIINAEEPIESLASVDTIEIEEVETVEIINDTINVMAEDTVLNLQRRLRLR